MSYRRRRDDSRDRKRSRSPPRRRESPDRRYRRDDSMDRRRPRRDSPERDSRREPSRRRADERVSREGSYRRDDDRRAPREGDDRRGPREVEDRRGSREVSRTGDHRASSRADERMPRGEEEERKMRREERFRSVPEPRADHRSREPEKPATAAPSFPGSHTVWIGSIGDGIAEDELFDLFMETGGPIAGMRIVHQRGFGYVRFVNEVDAQRVLEKRPFVIHNRKLRVDACEDMPTLQHPYRPAPGSKPPSCTTLFVGNLPLEVSEADLQDLFTSQGAVVTSVSLKRGGYKGLAFAHVRFDSGEACERAVDAVAGSRLKNSRIRLDWAVDKATEAPKSNEEFRGKTCKVYVGGLNETIEEPDVVHAFAPFGAVTGFRFHRDKAGVRSFGYITFAAPEAAVAAVDNAAHILVRGMKAKIDFARPDKTDAPVQREVRPRSPSPDQPRFTPISRQVPAEYGPMRSWLDCYGNSLINGTV